MSADQLAAAVAALRQGHLVAVPTETVYGLAAVIADERAVAAVFAAKGRPRFDPLIVHVSGADQARELVAWSDLAQRLADAFWPGPLTLVLPRLPGRVPDLVTNGLPTVGVRAPAHPLAQAVIAAAGPLAAPSANRFGRISPTTADHVRDQLSGAVRVVLDGGPCRVGIESTVLRLTPEPTILRPGGISAEALAEVVGGPVPTATSQQHAALIAAELPEAPGLLASHYAPRQPLTLITPNQPWPDDPQAGCLAFSRSVPRGEVLSPSGDLAAAAAQVFAALRRLEAADYQRIVAELVPAQGLGLAINDRLRRAAGIG